MNNETIFLVVWDEYGLETVFNVSDYSKHIMWATLSDSPAPSLGSILNTVLLRARYNSQRHYEIYTIKVADGVSEQDFCELFNNDPQTAANLIRDRGTVVLDNRGAERKIV